jgi:hypothetical protein
MRTNPPLTMSSTRSVLPVWMIALLAACALLSEASAADSVRLRYGFKPQASYEQALGLNLTMTFDPASVPAPLLALLQSMTGEIKQEVTSKARLQTKTRNADGTLPFEYKILEAKGTLTQGGQARAIPSLDKAAEKPPSQGHVTADGRQAILDVTDAATEGIPKRVRERVADSLPVLPDKDLRPGDTFETKTTMTLPGPSGKGERQVQAVWLYTLRTLTRKEATFDVKQTLPAAASMEVGQGQKMEMAGGGTGSAVFDLANGTFRTIQVNLDLTMTVDVPLPPGLTMNPDGSSGTGTQAGTTGGTPAPTRIKVLVKGPMTMTLGPT